MDSDRLKQLLAGLEGKVRREGRSRGHLEREQKETEETGLSRAECGGFIRLADLWPREGGRGSSVACLALLLKRSSWHLICGAWLCCL